MRDFSITAIIWNYILFQLHCISGATVFTPKPIDNQDKWFYNLQIIDITTDFGIKSKPNLYTAIYHASIVQR